MKTKIGNLTLITVLIIGCLVPFTIFPQSVGADAINGMQLIAGHGTVSYDKDGDGTIDLESPGEQSDEVGIKWTVDYAPATTHIRVIKNGIIETYDTTIDEDNNCEKIWRLTTELYFGSSNVIQVWHGEKSNGYSQVSLDLPKDVDDFPIGFEVKSRARPAVQFFNFLQHHLQNMEKFPLIKLLLNLL